VRLAALADLMGVQAGFPTPSLGAAVQHCGKDAASDEARQRDCSAIADALLTGATLKELSFAIAVGRNAGWSEDKVRSLQDRVDAINQMTPVWDIQDLWSCTFLETLEGYAVGQARFGEVGAGEEAAKQSGKTPRELAAQWREHLQTLRRNFGKSRR
jgi:hypothetical protein